MPGEKYYRKMAKLEPERFKGLIKRNKEALEEYIKMYTERIEWLKQIFKEEHDGDSELHEKGNGDR